MWIRLLTIAGLFLCFIALYCELPQPPPGPEKVTVELGYELPDGEIVKENYLTDTTGNQVKICMFLNLTQYLDSVVLKVTMGSDYVKMYSFSTYTGQTATATYPIIFSDPGNYAVTLTGYVEGEPKTISGTISIVSRPQISQNRKPVLNVKEVEKIGVNQELIFSVSANDSDANQQVTISASEMPESATFTSGLFKWTPGITDTGTVSVIFTATDNGSPVLSTSKSVIVIVSATPVNRAPKWNSYKMQRTTVPNAVFSLDLNSYCSDPDNDNLSFSLKPQVSAKDTIISKAYRFTPTISDTGIHMIYIIVADPSGLTDTLALELTVSNNYDTDTTGPAITLVTPNKDSITTSTSSYTIVVKCTDASGVLSVNGAAGATSYTGVRDTGSTWKITIGTLQNNKVTAIVLTATDSSIKANTKLDTVYIRSEIVNGYTITFDKNDSAATGTMGNQTINSGDSARLSINAYVKDGSTFAGWMTSPAGISIAYTDGAVYKSGTSSVTLYAKWNRKTTFILTIRATNGSVNKSPNAAVYDSGTVVTLTPVPAANYHFSGWTGALTGTTNPATIIMNSEKSVTAGFEINPLNSFSLTVLAENGTVTKSPNAVSYDSGTVVTLTATPSPGYQFTGWAGDLTGTTNPVSINMTGTKSVTANFAIKKFALTVNTTNGTVAKSPDATQYDSGTVVSLTATPSPGYQFTGWTGDLSGSTNPASITMAGAKSVTANFAIKKFALTVNVTNGTVAKSPDATSYDSGTVVSLTATPSPGYQFTGWSGGISGTTNPSSITMNGEKSVTANFGVIAFSVTYNANGGTGTVPLDPGSYTSGSLATVLPNSGKLVKNSESFIGWSNGGIGTIIACAQKIYISGNVTLYAQYSAYDVMDNDGNKYGTVTIGGKTWMNKNLKTTKYNNGDPIPFVEDEGAWKSLTIGAYCWPMNDTANKEYGALYNWIAVNTGNIAPAGWHVATAYDWYDLVDSLGCDSFACKIKETGETHWLSPNECATNSTYFYALGNGLRGRLALGEDAGFQGFKEYATWWTSTEYFVPNSNFGYLFFITNSLTENCSKNDFTDATVGYGVRCVKDE